LVPIPKSCCVQVQRKRGKHLRRDLLTALTCGYLTASRSAPAGAELVKPEGIHGKHDRALDIDGTRVPSPDIVCLPCPSMSRIHYIVYLTASKDMASSRAVAQSASSARHPTWAIWTTIHQEDKLPSNIPVSVAIFLVAGALLRSKPQVTSCWPWP
jgi:hypothetical protein